MIYFDNAATTRPYAESLKVFEEASAKEFYNPSALYSSAINLSKKIALIKKDFLKFLDAREDDNLIFLSGATEANNLAVFGSFFNKNKKYLFSNGEHPSVFNCALELKNRGYDVSFIPLQKNGQLDYEKFEEMMDENVCFVSVILLSNETGAINDLKKIRQTIDRKNPDCILHVDAVQAFCKIDFSVSKLKINLCSVSAHKTGGIKGVGALYVSKGTKIKNINFGGKQENGLRSGTVCFASILSFFSSAKLSFENKKQNFENALNLKEKLVSILNNSNNKVKVVSGEGCSPYIVSFYIEGHRGETLMRFLDSKGIFVGTGSACSLNHTGNRVLESMGLTKNQILGAVRISFGFENSLKELSVFEETLDNYFKVISV